MKARQLYIYGLIALLTTITPQDSDEIIAIQIQNTIYFGQQAMDMVLEHKNLTKPFSRAVFKFMATMDLSPKWAEYATSPTLFTMSTYEAYARGDPIGKTKSQPSSDDSESQR